MRVNDQDVIIDSYTHVQKMSSYHRNALQCQLRSYCKNKTKFYTEKMNFVHFSVLCHLVYRFGRVTKLSKISVYVSNIYYVTGVAFVVTSGGHCGWGTIYSK